MIYIFPWRWFTGWFWCLHAAASL